MDEHHAGIEIVSVLIEEIHPPAGAAGAYHAVQAAQINASASISQETGRAKRAAGVAQQEAHQLTAAADAQATETIAAANAESYRFNADRRAYAKAASPSCSSAPTASSRRRWHRRRSPSSITV